MHGLKHEWALGLVGPAFSFFFGCVMFGWFPGTDCVGTLLMDVLNVCVGVEAGGDENYQTYSG